MKTYIECEIIEAIPTSYGEFCVHADELPLNPFYSGSGYVVTHKEGYMSWIPKEIFIKNYEAGQFSFSVAIELLKNGKKVARVGWNGKNMCLITTPDTKLPVPIVYLVKKNIEGYDYLGVWNCTQADMLAEDWQEVK